MDLCKLYGNGADTASAEKRFKALADKFKKSEGCECEAFYSSSGRAEVLGNHTDHNHGKVLVAAISCDIIACVKRAANVITVHSEGYKDITVNLGELKKIKGEEGTSAGLVRGVARAISDRGYTFGGFTAHVTSNVFKGAGVSSSAAFEVLIAEIINDLYLGGKLSPVDKAVIAQYAENVYFGKPCGLLDQSGIAIGSLSRLDFLVPEKPVIEKLPTIDGYSFVITNTGGDHAKLTEHYAAIRKEMNEIASFFGKTVLRDVPYREFFAAVPLLKNKYAGRAILRAMHFYGENERVDRAANCVKTGDKGGFLECVNGSGISSLTLLQNCYVPGDVRQPVVLGTEVSRSIIKNGAVRVHGGGFAGSVLAVVEENETEGYISQMRKLFGDGNVFKAEIREKGTVRVDL